jgi:hypothetical protein
MTESQRWPHQVDVPPGQSEDVSIRPIVVEDSFMLRLRGRGTRPGVYTGLYRSGQLWMSDTGAEYSDHRAAIYAAGRFGGRVLINGLGLGMVIKAMLAHENVQHIDVVEIDPDVIALVAPTYDDPRVTIHQADAFTIKWPVGTRWTVVWHDIWPDISTENLPEIATLKRRYAQRCDWQGAWAEELAREGRRWG